MSSIDGLHKKKEALVSYKDEDVTAYHKNNFQGNGKLARAPKTLLGKVLDLILPFSPVLAVDGREVKKDPTNIDYT